jgi:hypothetical protein
MTFSTGDTVVVKDDWPERRGPAHLRTPHYLRGRKGRVLRSQPRRLGLWAAGDHHPFVPCFISDDRTLAGGVRE